MSGWALGSGAGSGPPKRAGLLCRLRCWTTLKAKKRSETRATKAMTVPMAMPASAPGEREVLWSALEGRGAELAVVVAAAAVSTRVEAEDDRSDATGAVDWVDVPGAGDAVGRVLGDVVVSKDELAGIGVFVGTVGDGDDGVGAVVVAVVVLADGSG
jgi:hypothetical protein